MPGSLKVPALPSCPTAAASGCASARGIGGLSSHTASVRLPNSTDPTITTTNMIPPTTASTANRPFRFISKCAAAGKSNFNGASANVMS